MYIVSFLRTGADEVASDETRSPVFVVCFRLNILNSFVYTVITSIAAHRKTVTIAPNCNTLTNTVTIAPNEIVTIVPIAPLYL